MQYDPQPGISFGEVVGCVVVLVLVFGIDGCIPRPLERQAPEPLEHQQIQAPTEPEGNL